MSFRIPLRLKMLYCREGRTRSECHLVIGSHRSVPRSRFVQPELARLEVGQLGHIRHLHQDHSHLCLHSSCCVQIFINCTVGLRVQAWTLKDWTARAMGFRCGIPNLRFQKPSRLAETRHVPAQLRSQGSPARGGVCH